MAESATGGRPERILVGADDREVWTEVANLAHIAAETTMNIRRGSLDVGSLLLSVANGG